MVLDDVLRAVVADAVGAAVAPLAIEIAQLRRQLDERLPQRWVTRTEAAEALNCSVDTVDRQVVAGALQAQRIGKRGVRVRLPSRPEAGEVGRLAREARGR